MQGNFGLSFCSQDEGQYQDLMVLTRNGSNKAFTYLKKDYGSLGREAG